MRGKSVSNYFVVNGSMGVSVAFGLTGIEVNFDLFGTYFRHVDSICYGECVSMRFASNIPHRLSQTIQVVKHKEISMENKNSIKIFLHITVNN